MKNILTVDLEDWFSVETLQKEFSKDKWAELDSVVQKNTETILDIFDRKNVKATFFILGWIADKYPSLISDVASRGHEIACHSYYHRMVSLITPEEFGSDREEVRSVLEAENIEARPVWKPMHLQPVFDCSKQQTARSKKRSPARVVGGEVAEDLFNRGLCLPSGTAMTKQDIDRIVKIIRKCSAYSK